MEERIWNRSGYLYRFATVYTNFNVDRGTDICSYTRAVAFGIFWWVAAIFASGLAAACLGDFGAWILVMVMSQNVFMPDVGAMIVVSALGMVAVVLVIFGVSTLNGKYKNKIVPGEVSEMYTSFKEKTCFRIRFE